jgi:hypothetical protein
MIQAIFGDQFDRKKFSFQKYKPSSAEVGE